MNRWNIPEWLEEEVRARDKSCVYCRTSFGLARDSRKAVATWEHIINDARIITRENIALCCFSCNSSKGTKLLSVWLKSDFCEARGITRETVADIVQRALESQASQANAGA